MKKTIFSTILFLMLFFLHSLPHAQKITDSFQIINPPPIFVESDKIEVIEFFAYSCPHCKKIEPLLEDWIRTKGDSIQFRRIHVDTQNTFALHQRLFYTFELNGLTSDYQEKVFNSIHVNQDYLITEHGIVSFISKNGLNKDKFLQQFYSPEVNQLLASAEKFQKSYGVTSWPTFVINGRYVTSPAMNTDQGKNFNEANANVLTIQTVDLLFERIRKDKKMAKSVN